MKNFFSKPPSFEGKIKEYYSQGFYIFETFLLENGQVLLAPFHLERINQTLNRLNWPKKIGDSNIITWWANLIESLKNNNCETKKRIKLSLIPDFEKNKLVFDLQQYDYFPPQKPIRLCFHPQAIRHSKDPLLSYKWGARVQMQFFLKDIFDSSDDVVFLNEKGEICETTRHNIYLEQNGILYTPPLHCGLLSGVMRAKLLQEKKAIEKILTIDDWKNTDNIFISNALLGICPARKSQ